MEQMSRSSFPSWCDEDSVVRSGAQVRILTPPPPDYELGDCGQMTPLLSVPICTVQNGPSMSDTVCAKCLPHCPAPSESACSDSLLFTRKERTGIQQPQEEEVTGSAYNEETSHWGLLQRNMIGRVCGSERFD